MKGHSPGYQAFGQGHVFGVGHNQTSCRGVENGLRRGSQGVDTCHPLQKGARSENSEGKRGEVLPVFHFRTMCLSSANLQLLNTKPENKSNLQ